MLPKRQFIRSKYQKNNKRRVIRKKTDFIQKRKDGSDVSSRVLQVQERSPPGPFHLTARRSPKWVSDRSSAKRFHHTATGTCNSTSRKPRTCVSTIIFLVEPVSASTQEETLFLRTRSTIFWKYWVVSRPEPHGRPMLVLLYVPLPHFSFFFSRIES